MAKLSKDAVAAGLLAGKRLSEGETPSQSELNGAPNLSHWILSDERDGYPRLGGFVTGHPELGDGWCWTSVVVFIEPELQWARTISRLYRLGERFRLDRDARVQ